MICNENKLLSRKCLRNLMNVYNFQAQNNRFDYIVAVAVEIAEKKNENNLFSHVFCQNLVKPQIIENAHDLQVNRST